MQQFNGRPVSRERKEELRKVNAPSSHQDRDRRYSGEPSRYNTRSEERRIVWENDLYERQSI